MVRPTKVNCPVNVVRKEQAKGADRLEPKGNVVGMGAESSPIADKDNPRRMKQGLTRPIGGYAERGKPVSLPKWESLPQGEPMVVRVKEHGKSESWPVMGQIEVEHRSSLGSQPSLDATSPHAKAGRLP